MNPEPTHRPPTWSLLFGGLLLAIAGLAVYLPTFQNGWTLYDDPDYVTKNPHVLSGLNLANLRWSFVTYHASNWHPMTWISHMLDAQIFGPNDPHGPHAVNLILHVVSGWLLYLLLGRTTRDWPLSFVVALLFLIHPVQVENVAWISQRKSLLAMVFLLGTILAYSESVLRRSWAWYVVACCLYSCCLLSKPVGVIVPILLCLWDYWPLGRWNGGRGKILFWDKLPFVALAMISCVITLNAQVAAISSEDVLPWSIRWATAVTSIPAYLKLLFWPTPLVVFRPHPLVMPATETIVASVLFIVVVTASAWWFRRNLPFLLVGWLWFVVSLMPSLGIVQVGAHDIADRYLYVPIIGIAVALTWGLSSVFCRVMKQRRGLFALMGVAGIVLSVLTWQQTELWKSSMTLFTYANRHSQNNYIAYVQLSREYYLQGDTDKAHQFLEEAYRVGFRWPSFLRDLASLRANSGQLGPAEEMAQEALARGGPSAEVYVLLAEIAYVRRDFPEAKERIAKAIEISPRNPEALELKGRIDRAVRR